MASEHNSEYKYTHIPLNTKSFYLDNAITAYLVQSVKVAESEVWEQITSASFHATHEANLERRAASSQQVK